ncbi:MULTISPECIES: hypothetical protein [Citrobacter freundii complex]|uniref:hypothetical protein n=1 Tax=Citrobacter freundii complex TaxID=1344959 RepID=UPI0012385753|nr:MULTISPECIES: hypothetical protein [Citrobacter]QET66179.1 hypothetical protein FOB24_11570 [Citrobacter werkmanii]
MTDIAFTRARDSNRGVKVVHKKMVDVRSNGKYTSRDQLAIAAVLFLGGIAGAIVLAMYLMMQEGVFLY